MSCGAPRGGRATDEEGRAADSAAEPLRIQSARHETRRMATACRIRRTGHRRHRRRPSRRRGNTQTHNNATDDGDTAPPHSPRLEQGGAISKDDAADATRVKEQRSAIEKKPMELGETKVNRPSLSSLPWRTASPMEKAGHDRRQATGDSRRELQMQRPTITGNGLPQRYGGGSTRAPPAMGRP